MVGRDSSGRVVFFAGKILIGCFDVQMAETLAILYELQIATSSTYRDIICESDSQEAIRNLCNHCSSLSILDEDLA